MGAEGSKQEERACLAYGLPTRHDLTQALPFPPSSRVWRGSIHPSSPTRDQGLRMTYSRSAPRTSAFPTPDWNQTWGLVLIHVPIDKKVREGGQGSSPSLGQLGRLCNRAARSLSPSSLLLTPSPPGPGPSGHTSYSRASCNNNMGLLKGNSGALLCSAIPLPILSSVPFPSCLFYFPTVQVFRSL